MLSMVLNSNFHGVKDVKKLSISLKYFCVEMTLFNLTTCGSVMCLSTCLTNDLRTG